MIKADIAIDAGYIVQMNDHDSIIHGGTLLIKGSKIVYVGVHLDSDSYQSLKYIDANDSIVLPPFFNQHTHPSLSVYRGLGVDLPLNEWLEKAMYPLEKQFSNPENVYLGSMLSIVEMIKSGIGATTNMDYHNHDVGKAYSKAGVRAFLGEAILETETPSCKTPDDAFEYTESLVEGYKNSELIRTIISVHAPYTSTPELYEKAALLAEKLNILTTSHVSETKGENDWSLKKYGLSPVEMLESTGILESDFILIHGVHLSDKDIQILSKHRIPVVHNPHSNMVLGSGICNIPKLHEAGIKVGLGTDSAASNNSLNMMKEMQTMSRLQKVASGDASLLSAKQALHMGTRTGYDIYKIEETGQLKVGYNADLQIIKTSSSHTTPSLDPISTLVYSSHGSDVDTLIVNGKVLMQDRKILTVDEEVILKEANKLAKNIRSFIGL